MPDRGLDDGRAQGDVRPTLRGLSRKETSQLKRAVVSAPAQALGEMTGGGAASGGVTGGRAASGGVAGGGAASGGVAGGGAANGDVTGGEAANGRVTGGEMVSESVCDRRRDVLHS